MSLNFAASLAEASSPCSSVKRVYPRMSAMRKVRTDACGSTSRLPTSVRPANRYLNVTAAGTGCKAKNTPFVASTEPAAKAVNELERQRAEMHGAFGNDAFGRLAEKAARFFGTPQYILGQTVAVLAWVVLNSTQLHLGFAWDVYPFIALNLLFSLQAAYAAPLILLAQTRQADRDKIHSDRIDKNHSRLERASKTETDKLLELLQSNTDITLQDKELTEQVADLTKQIHAFLTKQHES
jgi:uncharacterized membrane protein